MRITAIIALSLLLATAFTEHAVISPSTAMGAILAQTAGNSTATPKEAPNAISKFKDLADALHSIATIIALIVGGWWTYDRFIKKREEFPRAKISHSITHRKIDNEFQLLHVALNVQNAGELLLRLNEGVVRVQQVIPAPLELLESLHASDGGITKENETECEWPLLDEHNCQWRARPHEMEPGEDENIEFDFVVASEVKTVEVYSYFRNETRYDREIGWNLTTLYDLQETQIAEKRDRGPGKRRITLRSTEKQP